MKKLNKVTSEVYKRLKGLAAELPSIQRANGLGEPLFKIVTEYTGGSKYYRKKIPLLANHEVALIEAWKVSGENGVQYYLNLIAKVAAKPLPKEEEEVSKESPQT